MTVYTNARNEDGTRGGIDFTTMTDEQHELLSLMRNRSIEDLAFLAMTSMTKDEQAVALDVYRKAAA